LFALWIAFCWRLEFGKRVSRQQSPVDARFKVRKPTKALSRLSDNNENKPAPALPPGTMRAIGRELRRMYAHIIAEGVPERFIAILRRLDEPSDEARHREGRRRPMSDTQ
jgi:hypothetical protein